MRFRATIFLLILSIMLAACGNGDDNSNGNGAVVEDQTTPSAATATVEPDDSTTTPQDTAQMTPDASPTSEPEAAASPDASPTPVEAQIDEIIDAVVEIRQLEPQEEIETAVIPRDELRGNLQEIFEDTYSREQAEQDARLLWMFRLIEDRSVDLYQLELDLLTEQVLGYYDPQADELYVVSEESDFDTSDQIVASQEIVHALQDQHFDLTQAQSTGILGDQARAFDAVVEGDGNITMLFYAQQELSQQALQEFLQESQQAPAEVFEQAPPYIQSSLLFPYEAGIAFVEAVYAEGGYALVNEALENPPASTEIILHPEKFLESSSDQPVDVANPSYEENLTNGWDESVTGTLGEWDLLQLLELNGATMAQQAAAGWGGSSFSFYTSGNEESAIALDTVWDSEQDAQEFVAALEETMADYQQEGEIWIGPERVYSISSEGDSVQFLTATSQAVLEEMLAAEQ